MKLLNTDVGKVLWAQFKAIKDAQKIWKGCFAYYNKSIVIKNKIDNIHQYFIAMRTNDDL